MPYNFSIHTSNPVSLGDYFGYSVAYYGIKSAIESTKIDNEYISVLENSPKAKIQLHMGRNPGRFYDHQYKIQMSQWESTLAPSNWAKCAKRYNEFWTANHWGAQGLINSGIPEKKIYVVEHGVDSSIWTPAKRGMGNKIRFLHIDSDNPRKRSDLALKAFKNAFGDNPDYELTLKYSLVNAKNKITFDSHNNLDWSRFDILEHGGDWHKNVRVIRSLMNIDNLIKLYHFHDVLIYPSEGEGFGLIPLQALVTGMPVISTGRWPSYEKYFQNNIIDSTLGPSTYLKKFRGDCIIPDLDSTTDLLKQVADNISSQSSLFYSQVPDIQQEYSWQNKVEPAILKLYQRIPDRFK